MNWDAPLPATARYASGVYLGDMPMPVVVGDPVPFTVALSDLRRTLPPIEGRWASLTHPALGLVIGWAWLGHLRWGGSLAAFNALRELWPTEDVEWWALMAEHFDLQDQ